MSPETAVSPLQQAPPDRPTMDLEMALRQVMAIIFGDHVMDPREQKIFYGFMEEVAIRAQNGGVGRGATPPAEMGGAAPGPSPMDMNQNVQDMGTVEGAEPMMAEEEVY